MANKFGLLAVAAAAIAYSPMVAFGCSGSSAQLNDGTTVAQGYGSYGTSTAQPAPNPSASQTTDQSGMGTSGSDSSADK